MPEKRSRASKQGTKKEEAVRDSTPAASSATSEPSEEAARPAAPRVIDTAPVVESPSGECVICGKPFTGQAAVQAAYGTVCAEPCSHQTYTSNFIVRKLGPPSEDGGED